MDRALALLAPAIASDPTDARALVPGGAMPLGAQGPGGRAHRGRCRGGGRARRRVGRPTAAGRTAGAGRERTRGPRRTAPCASPRRTRHAHRARHGRCRLSPNDRQGNASAAQAVRLAPGDPTVHVMMGNVFWSSRAARPTRLTARPCASTPTTRRRNVTWPASQRRIVRWAQRPDSSSACSDWTPPHRTTRQPCAKCFVDGRPRRPRLRVAIGIACRAVDAPSLPSQLRRPAARLPREPSGPHLAAVCGEPGVEGGPVPPVSRRAFGMVAAARCRCPDGGRHPSPRCGRRVGAQRVHRSHRRRRHSARPVLPRRFRGHRERRTSPEEPTREPPVH